MADEIKRDELRRERKNRLAEREKELDDIKVLRDEALRNREAAEKAYHENKYEITTLEKQKETYGHQIEDLKGQMRQTSGFDGEERAGQNAGKVNQLMEDDMTRLKQIEIDKSNKNEELRLAKISLDYWKNISASNPKNVKSDTQSVKRDLAKAQGAYDEIQRDIDMLEAEKTELTERIAGYGTRGEGATTDRAAASPGGDSERQIVLLIPEKKTAGTRILEEMKKKAVEQILAASSKTTQLLADLNHAKSEEQRLKKREEDKKLELDNMKDCDQSKHAKIMVYIQQNLVTKNINLLLNYLELRISFLSKRKREDLRDFFDIWQYLSSLEVRQGGIEVGDLRNIRNYLSNALEDSKNLVKEIAKMEDALLGEYKKGRTPTVKAEDDTQSKQIKSFSQMIDANIKHKKYKDDGGPFKYLSDVLVVVRLYLAQLNTRDKSEVTDALHDYVKSRLEQSDILTLVDGHLREHKKGTGKITQLEKDIKERDTKIGELEQEINTINEKHKKEAKSLWSQFKSALSNTQALKDDYETKINDYEKRMKDSAESWEEARQKMVNENVELRAQKESTDKHIKEMMGELRGVTQLADTRFENMEEERKALCMETMQSYIEQMRVMMVKHADEEQARREEHTKNMAALQKSFEDAKATWERHRSEEREGTAQRMDEFYEKIKELEREFGTSLVEWENERMELRQGLFMAEMQNMMAEYNISRLEKAN